jgi:hypothetical protein
LNWGRSTAAVWLVSTSLITGISFGWFGKSVVAKKAASIEQVGGFQILYLTKLGYPPFILICLSDTKLIAFPQNPCQYSTTKPAQSYQKQGALKKRLHYSHHPAIFATIITNRPFPAKHCSN